MRILIVLGAGASLDCWPGNSKIIEYERIPLANKLFAPLLVQEELLNKYELMGIASLLRKKYRIEGDNFDIEKELGMIASRAAKNKDLNNEKGLFKIRFYLHSLIVSLTKQTLNHSSHTTYVDLLEEIKDWIEVSPSNRKVDIITFNYDDLIERAMDNVYSYDWKLKHPLTGYYEGNNLNIFKPHGSVNWGRIVEMNGQPYMYSEYTDAFRDFNKIDLKDDFQYVNVNDFRHSLKNYVPAIAVPVKNKVDFKECPPEMYRRMSEAVGDASIVITIGWKGGDAHFTKLIKDTNSKVKKIHVIGPSGETSLVGHFPDEFFEFHKFGFSQFVSNSVRFGELLHSLSVSK